MKICYISNATSSDVGGTTIHPVEVATFLSNIAEVHLIVTECPKIKMNKRLNVYQLGKFSVQPKIAWYVIRLLRLLDTLVHQQNMDIIYARNPGSGFLAYLVGKRYSKPVICEINGLPETGIYYKSRKTIPGWLNSICSPLLKSFYLKAAVKRVEHIISVTDNIKQVLVTRYKIDPSKITVIPNGANTDLFCPVDESEARETLNLSEEYNYVCFIGSLFYWQGLHNLIKSAPLVLEQYPDTRFLIIGDGPMKKELIEQARQAGISDNVVFTGAVSYEKVPLYINAGDVCVVPKIPLKSGYSPLKLYEYMACGRPVIATRTDGFEVLEEKNAGLLVNPENSAQFADAIMQLLADKELGRRMGENGRTYVLENHSWESVARRVADVCQQTIQKYTKQHEGK